MVAQKILQAQGLHPGFLTSIRAEWRSWDNLVPGTIHTQDLDPESSALPLDKGAS